MKTALCHYVPSTYVETAFYAAPAVDDERCITPYEQWVLTSKDGAELCPLTEDQRHILWDRLVDPVTGEQWNTLRDFHQTEGPHVRWYDQYGNLSVWYPSTKWETTADGILKALHECIAFAHKVGGYVAWLTYASGEREYQFISDRSQAINPDRDGWTVDIDGEKVEAIVCEHGWHW